MGKLPDSVLLPANDEEAVNMAVRDLLKAANTLCTAADMTEDSDIASHYINTAIRIRDMANWLLPDRPDWPENVIPFVPKSVQGRE